MTKFPLIADECIVSGDSADSSWGLLIWTCRTKDFWRTGVTTPQCRTFRSWNSHEIRLSRLHKEAWFNNHRFLPVTRTILIIYTGEALTGYITTIGIRMAPAQLHFSHPSWEW